MKTTKAIIPAVAMTLLVAGCNFLDKAPTMVTTGSYYTTESDAESALNGVYAILTQSSFYGADYFYLTGGDDLEFYGGQGRSPADRGLCCNNATTSDPAVTGYWYSLYSGINRANMLLENIDHISDIGTANKKQWTAEARFLRAFYYFNLVQGWGDVPFTTSSTKTVKGLSIPRTDKETIYDFIVKEMDESANDLLSASTLNYRPGRVSKSAAWGILARVLMFRAGEHYRDGKSADNSEILKYFRQAGEYAQKVMGENHGLATHYWDYFIDLCKSLYNSKGNESIWEAEFAGNYTTDTRNEGRVGNIIGIQGPDLSSTTLTGQADPGYGYSFFWSTPKLYELYEKNADINRMNWNIAPFTYTQSVAGKGVDGRVFEKGKLAEVQQQYWDESYQYGLTTPKDKKGDREKEKTDDDKGLSCGKYRREYEADKKSKNFTAINFPILRYADVLLMVAECENETHDVPTSLAYQCINAVRRRAGIAELSGLDKAAFRQAVKDERAMELCFEMIRHFDLIRWGEFKERMNELAPRAQAGTSWKLGPSNVYTYFQVSDTYNYFPIPANEIAVNKSITKNNPGW